MKQIPPGGYMDMRPPEQREREVTNLKEEVRRLTEKPTGPPSFPETGVIAGGRRYFWFEAEKKLTGQNYLTADFWEPSGGLFLYRPKDAPPATAQFTVPTAGPWTRLDLVTRMELSFELKKDKLPTGTRLGC